eukprot:Lithocolla_globosa_v1_NODE_1229_length_2754_cov_204.732593.p1 type:complete len:403 gc:universal NODE_1229_length_2754_cov_204.732593:2195-987(-)
MQVGGDGKLPLDYVGPPPEAKYWPGGKMEDGLPTEWNLKEYSIKYHKLDVIAMGICYVKYCRMMFEITGLNASHILTQAGLSYQNLVQKTREHDIRIIKNFRVDEWMRKAVIGGCNLVQKRQFKAHRYDEVMAVWDKSSQEERADIVKNWVDDGLCDFDEASLYPSAMALFEYPVGEAAWLTSEGCSNLIDQLHAKTYSRLSIVECDITFPDKDIVLPLIPTWNGPRREYNCFDKKNLVISSVDLEEAIRYNGIRITKIHRALEWEKKAFVFKDVVTKLFKLRLAAKKNGDETLSAMLKLLLNSGYGKFEQRLIWTTMEVISTNAEFERRIFDGTMKTYDILNDEKIMMEVHKKITDNSNQYKSVQMGIFILSYSKRIMNQAVDAVGGFQNFENAFTRTPTQ